MTIRSVQNDVVKDHIYCSWPVKLSEINLGKRDYTATFYERKVDT